MARRVFFTSDTHFGHGNIVKFCKRPFLGERDKEELAKIGAWHSGDWHAADASSWRMTDEAITIMDNVLIQEINNMVGKNDILWHLGDFAMPAKHRNYFQACQEYRERIVCENVNIVWGNHDHPDQIHSLFSEDHHLTHIKVNKTMIVLCHYLMGVWDNSHRNAIQLYGHSHSEAEAAFDKIMPGRKSMDVGVDNIAKLFGAYRPISFDEVMEYMSHRQGFSYR